MFCLDISHLAYYSYFVFSINIKIKYFLKFILKLIKEGYIYKDDTGSTNCYLYEGDIPPLLKLFHIKEISPSGWICLNKDKIRKSKI